ncbi:hypothetical protein KGM_215551 [Danaus plexippus plexippus]|uniref:Uncharacterized protein n=1 Tax=Danaus plexippus plexippus TaxID=278856 RepID=A0A212ER74_DANPL|nr:hypothetical protein KGM_215551 [Danaus plexippus plexippus]
MEVAVTESNKHPTLKLKNVILHLDFKGSPPKLSYLKTLLPKLQSLGVTGLLMEYEDMFPYEGKLVNLSAENHYEIIKLQEFVTIVVRLGLDLIPLVQTFGHLEHALKLREFQHLRENPLYPDSICPSQSESYDLIKAMLDQIINFHENIFPLKYLHIGSDEVYHIKECKKCLRSKLTDMDIYLSHVEAISHYIKIRSPLTTVLLWDDMLRKIPMKKWRYVTLGKTNIEPVYWDYKPSIKVSHTSLIQYHKKFKNIWIASAFKGADGRVATFPDLRKRLLNNFSWLNLIFDYKFGGESEIYEFSGIILTGWSRYSHMDPPCELLPVATPSLYLNLLMIKTFKYSDSKPKDISIALNYINKDFSTNLHCQYEINIDNFNSIHCHFEGNELFKLLMDCEKIINDITKTIADVETDLSTLELYSKNYYNNINMWTKNFKWCIDSINSLNDIREKLIGNLSHYYGSSFVTEYVDYKLFNTENIIKNIMKILNNMFKVKNWKRRLELD